MIVSASYRTDIPAFYADWFARRLDAGFCDVGNPYSGKNYRVRLDREHARGFIFWTRNPRPLAQSLDRLYRAGTPFVIQATVTGYPRSLETSVIPPADAINQLHELRERYGPDVVVWRYDPVVMTSATTAPWHHRNFQALCEALRTATTEVALSFVTIYQKTRRNLNAASRKHGLVWEDPGADEKRGLLAELAAIAGRHGLRATLCSQPELMAPGLEPARCVDMDRMSLVAGIPVTARRKGNRPGCECADSRDIGAYDTCPHGCVYCYAVRKPALAKSRYQRHDPTSSILIPGRNEADKPRSEH